MQMIRSAEKSHTQLQFLRGHFLYEYHFTYKRFASIALITGEYSSAFCSAYPKYQVDVWSTSTPYNRPLMQMIRSAEKSHTQLQLLKNIDDFSGGLTLVISLLGFWGHFWILILIYGF
jgi:hypothetical protein